MKRLSVFAPLRRDEPFDDEAACRAVVQRRRVHEIEARQFILRDGIHHCLGRAIADGLADAGRGAHAPSRVVRDASSRTLGGIYSTRGRVERHPRAGALPFELETETNLNGFRLPKGVAM